MVSDFRQIYPLCRLRPAFIFAIAGLWILFATAFDSVAQQNIHHELEVEILHDAKMLRGIDTIHLPKGASRLRVAFRPGVRILSVEGEMLSMGADGRTSSVVLPPPSWLVCARYSARSGRSMLWSGSATIVTSSEIASANGLASSGLKVTPMIRMPWIRAARNSMGGRRSGVADTAGSMSRINLQLLGLSFQPLELVKVAIVVALALVPVVGIAFGIHLLARFDEGRREGLEPAACWMIGDRATDVRAGRSNGTKTVGVLWGYGSDKFALSPCMKK